MIQGENIRILKRLEEEKVLHQLNVLYNEGYRNIAVSLMHSYAWPEHELIIGKLANQVGFQSISLSHQVIPMIKLVPRASSTCVDAYLTPCIQKYITSFAKGFDHQLFDRVSVLFMGSDGGLSSVSHVKGFNSILSGPAGIIIVNIGGVVGFAQTSLPPLGLVQETKPVIGFDMGGTSTDVARFFGKYDHVLEGVTAGIPIQAPQLDINTVAAGGGSCLNFINGLFVVGPQSAGSNPGPCCYKRSGPLTITDANLILGRIVPDFFPKIFGPNRNEALDLDATTEAFIALSQHVQYKSLDEIAHGFIKVANET